VHVRTTQCALYKLVKPLCVFFGLPFGRRASLQSLAAENVSAKTRDLQGEIAQKSK